MAPRLRVTQPACMMQGLDVWRAGRYISHWLYLVRIIRVRTMQLKNRPSETPLHHLTSCLNALWISRLIITSSHYCAVVYYPDGLIYGATRVHNRDLKFTI